MKFLSLYRLTPVYALLLTVGTYLLVGTIGAGPSEPGGFMRAMLTERGPVPYLIVFLTFCTLSMVVLARIREEQRVTFLLGMYGVSFLSILAGMLASFAGFTHSLLGLLQVDALLKQETVDLDAIRQNVQAFIHGVATAGDTTHLALLLTFISWPAVIWCCVRTPNTKQGL